MKTLEDILKKVYLKSNLVDNTLVKIFQIPYHKLFDILNIPQFNRAKACLQKGNTIDCPNFLYTDYTVFTHLKHTSFLAMKSLENLIIILACLLHDIGKTPFGHCWEYERVNKREFRVDKSKHESYGIKLVKENYKIIEEKTGIGVKDIVEAILQDKYAIYDTRSYLTLDTLFPVYIAPQDLLIYTRDVKYITCYYSSFSLKTFAVLLLLGYLMFGENNECFY